MVMGVSKRVLEMATIGPYRAVTYERVFSVSKG
jgi:hypothetical protein